MRINVDIGNRRRVLWYLPLSLCFVAGYVDNHIGSEKMTSLFDEFIGEQLERIHVTPEGLGDYKSVTLNFANGKCLHLNVELHSRKDAIYPAIRATTGNWEMIKAFPNESNIGPEEPKEPQEPELDTNVIGPSVEDKKLWRMLCAEPKKPLKDTITITITLPSDATEKRLQILDYIKSLGGVKANHVDEICHIPDCAIYNNPSKGFASSVSDCDCGAEDVKDVKKLPRKVWKV